MGDKVTFCGWPVLANMEFAYRPDWRPQPTLQTLPQKTINEVEELFELANFKLSLGCKVKFDDQGLQGDLVAHVMKVYDEWVPCQANKPTSQPQVMHGLANAISASWGPHWARDVILSGCDVIAHHGHVHLFNKARFLVILLQDGDHWALMLVSRGRKLAVFYDGRPTPGTSEAFEKCVKSLSDFYGCAFRTKVAQVPQQCDQWSCGHRVVLHARWAFDFLKEGSWEALPVEVPEEAVNQFLINQFIAAGPFLPPSCPVTAAGEAGDKDDGPPCKKPKVLNPVKMEQDSTSSEPACKKRKLQGTIEKEKQQKNLKDLERQLETDHGFSHNKDFQKEHQLQQVKTQKGHWQSFLLAMLNDEPLTCKACQTCRDTIRSPAVPPAPAQESVALVPFEADRDILQPRKRGRPTKSSQPWIGLKQWMVQNRPCIYQLVEEDTNTWYCKLCCQKLKLQRDSTTFVAKHEQRQLHIAKLAMMNAAIGGDLESTEALCAQAQFQPCQGVNVDQQESLAPKMFAIQESFHIWLRSGMPFATGDKKCPLQQISLSLTSQGLVLKHKQCTGEEVQTGCCHKCHSLSESKIVVDEVKKWAFRLDLIQLQHALVSGSKKEITEIQEMIQSRDYYQVAEHGQQLKTLLSRPPADAAYRIRSMVICIAAQRRNPSLQALIDSRLQGQRSLLPRNMETDVFHTLVEKYQDAVADGKCHHEQFRLAAQVASGKLENEPIVECLFKSALAKISRVERGGKQRTCTSKFVDSELAMEMMIVLGRSKATENFLQSLARGVNRIFVDCMYVLVFGLMSLFISCLLVSYRIFAVECT